MQSRREFMQRGGAALAASPALLVLLEGCTPAEVVSDLNVVLSEATNIIAAIEPNAPWFTAYKNAVAALKVAEQGWTGGGAVSVVIEALQTVEDVTAVIPLTEPYSPLIDVLVASIDTALLALAGLLKPIKQPAPQPAPLAARAALNNPHKGRAKVKNAADSKAQFNAGATGPLAIARI